MSPAMDWSCIFTTVAVFGAGVLAGAFFRRKGYPAGAERLKSSFENLLSPSESRKLKLLAVRAANPSRTHKLVMIVRTDLGMGKGKIAAQCAHAAVSCYQKAQMTHQNDLDIWEATGCTKICLRCEDGEEGLQLLQKEAKKLNFVTALIHDAGHTQVASGTATVLGVGPAPVEQLNEVTGKLRLFS